MKTAKQKLFLFYFFLFCFLNDFLVVCVCLDVLLLIRCSITNWVYRCFHQPLRGISGGIQRVVASTLQAVSGAGYPGLPSLDILDNVIPFIDGELMTTTVHHRMCGIANFARPGEEEKIELEPRKILGQLCPDGGFTLSDMTISATCHRVAVTDGHTASVRLTATLRDFPR